MSSIIKDPGIAPAYILPSASNTSKRTKEPHARHKARHIKSILEELKARDRSEHITCGIVMWLIETTDTFDEWYDTLDDTDC